MIKKRIHLTLVLAISLIVSSCEFFYPDTNGNKTVHIMTMGFAYAEMKNVNMLDNTLRDQHGMTEQLVALAESCGYGYEVLEFNDGSYPAWEYPAFEGDNAPERRGIGYRYYNNRGQWKTDTYTPIQAETRQELVQNVCNAIRDNISVDEDDLLFFYYSGHGYQTGLVVPFPDKNDYAFLGPDMLYSVLDPFDCRQLLILDCCNSGIFLEDGDLGSTLDYRQDGELDLQKPAGISTIISEAFAKGFSDGKNGSPVRHVISAASARQNSWDDDSLAAHGYAPYYGAFTIWVLDYLGYDFENLSGTYRTDDGILSAADLYNHAYSHLRDATRITATPNITASRYDLVLFEL